jgi:hypothetical protein
MTGLTRVRTLALELSQFVGAARGQQPAIVQTPYRHPRTMEDHDRPSRPTLALTWHFLVITQVLNSPEFHADGAVQISHGRNRPPSSTPPAAFTDISPAITPGGSRGPAAIAL